MFADVENLKNLIEASLRTYKNTAELDRSAALLSRLIARRASSFRKQLGFKLMRQMNIALCRWKELNIADTLTNIHEGISLYQMQGQYNIPTKVNFEYLLIRLQCAAKLLIRIVTSAKEAFRILTDFIEKAFFIDLVTLYLGVLAHIWRICVELCRNTVNLYNEIMSIVKPHFFNKDRDNAKTGQFPDRLDEWMGDDWLEINVQTQVESIRKQQTDPFSFDISAFNSAEINHAIKHVQAGNDRGKEIKVKKEGKTKVKIERKEFLQIEKAKPLLQMNKVPNLNTKNPQQSTAIPDSPGCSFDLGEALCRDTLQSKEIKQEPKVEPIDVSRIFTMKDLLNFIQSEDALRSSGKHQQSRMFNNDQWKRFKLKINNMIEAMDPWACVKRFKGLWRSSTGNAANKR